MGSSLHSVVRNWSPGLALDPALEGLGVLVQGMRFTSGDEPAFDDQLRYEIAIALRRKGKRWPRGEYIVQTYDDADVMISSVRLNSSKTLDKEIRQLSEDFYATAHARAELIFDPSSDTTMDAWEALDITADGEDAEVLGIRLRSLRAEVRPDFEYNNLLMVRVSAQATPSSGLPFPSGLHAQLTVLDAVDVVLTTAQVDLRRGPSTRRNIDEHLKVYNHMEPDHVLVEVFTI